MTIWDWFNEKERPAIVEKRSQDIGKTFKKTIDQLIDEANEAFKSLSSKNLGEAFNPEFSIAENEGQYEIKFEIPGVKKEDIKIQRENHYLIVKGEKKEEVEEKGKDYHKRVSYGSFSKTISLPDNADLENIRSRLENGVLTIYIKKKQEEKAQKKEIPIEG